MEGVSVAKLAEALKLKTFSPCVDMTRNMITTREVNRPGLELTGYFEHFAEDRVQILGKVECSYLERIPEDKRKDIYDHLLGDGVPCVIFCRGFEPDVTFLKTAAKYQVSVLGTTRETSSQLAATIAFLSAELAPCISIHGVLVDVYGEGVLIMGESGIGKSEAALELIRRGHRLVSDDVVEIRRISDDTLVGSSPDITRYFIELRGIGIVDVKTLFGVECVKETQNIDMVIKLEEWDKEREYDRLGLEEEYTDILGAKVICYAIPIRPGRNLAVICETAAVNHRQKKMGYNAAQELYRRVSDNLKKGNQES
ncbi:MAG: HPr(Ser) kinase/phosphatase [Lachnospiraceae bacterium]|jgi:HPr kinase/phosphorylase|uniref:HPr(Ser) kinase/phosphatase n=1 Tax=Clostridium sp. (strain SY8519) TaxID=1042156 RepID=UPI0002171FB9|nr:HPr(Ser) kinase/phosphatase [Clostridium sp. SY8519]MCI1653887.1 HPr(Ser) kinase/phosphatase [Lachnospiraceae bacterium]MCI1656201.1 HPr(Ser) kinase/phosphatase [Lachnospiraceae bacterium]MCI2194683.1 HPr(Ser) kinase/phosphatase [Lachnospiraceae bacterium]BAK47284.1 serine kinase of the HPr protein [Clostridium sp. SY8519]